jgi:hypothetical protein
MGVDSLAALCKRIEDTVRGVAEAGTGTYDLIVDVTVRPNGQPGFQLGTKGLPLAEELQRIHNALGAQSTVNTRGAELNLRCFAARAFVSWNRARLSIRPVPVYSSWSPRCQGLEGDERPQ